MLRKLIPVFFLITFLTATTGFVIEQCCCDTKLVDTCCAAVKEPSCCQTASHHGCKSDVKYYKLKTTFHGNDAQQVSFFASGFARLVFRFDFFEAGLLYATRFTNTGPPLLASRSTELLQVFRI